MENRRPRRNLSLSPTHRLRATMTFFIRGCPPTKAIGWKPVITATVSDRVSQRIGNPTKTDTGFGPTVAGTGTQTDALPLEPTTMADGSILVGPDGAGLREINGLRLGFLGGKATKRLAGLLSRPKQTYRGTDPYRLGPTPIMALDRLLTRLSAILIGTNRAMPRISSHLSGTFRSSARQGTSLTLSPTTMWSIISGRRFRP